MDASTFATSANVVMPFFGRLTEAGGSEPGMSELRAIGVEAEQVMLAATNQINTHRGAIFGLGLICAAAGVAWSTGRPSWQAERLTEVVRQRWGRSILGDPADLGSHGAAALKRFGAGGARAEAAAGFPHVLEIALPELRQARLMLPDDPEAARVQAFFALLAEVDDTNLLHRGGSVGLRFAQLVARAFLADGGVRRPGWREEAASIHKAFIKRRLSPGGCADLLAVTLLLDALETASHEPDDSFVQNSTALAASALY